MLTLQIIPAPRSNTDPRPAFQEISSLTNASSITRLPDLLRNTLRGPAKIIPDFDSILRNGDVQPCLALCNAWEVGEPNTWANLLWLQHLVRTYGFSEARAPSVVRGPLALIFGSSESILENWNQGYEH